MTDKKLPPAIPYDEGMTEFYRKNPQIGLEVMSDALACGDQETFMEVLGYLIKGTVSISALANLTKLNEKTLHRTLSRKGNPTLKTLLSIFNALHFSLKISPMPEKN